VIAEVVASVVLLVSSGLLIRALWRVQSVDPGFKTSGILSLRTELPFPKYNKTSTREQFYGKVLTDVRRLPGVMDAAYITALPMTWGGGIWPVLVNGRSRYPHRRQFRQPALCDAWFIFNPGHSHQIGTRRQRNRHRGSALCRRGKRIVGAAILAHEQPIGRHFNFGFHDHEVIGVVGDIRARGLERTSEPQVYLSYMQDPDDGLTYYAPKDLVIHSSQPPELLLPAIRQIIHAADPEQPISNIRTMEEVVAGETESRTIQMRVLVVFTGVAIVLAGLGIYGLLAFTVSMRQQEFGIRLALGAGHGDIFKMVLVQARCWQWPACCQGWRLRTSRPD
jgi:hypothetical protein